ncbi:Uncharacterized protein Rs2_50924 [Raphanus sativus]|nr:Uncharacterized protein Rs2_50924 [Raphanus sativus]
MEEEGIATRRTYWCHMCSRTVDPLMEAEIKCPFCASGFVEEMSDEEEHDDHRANSTSLWAPILMQLVNNPNQTTVEDSPNHVAEAENEAAGNDVDSQLQEILRRRRGRSSVSVIRLSLHGVGGGSTLEPDENNNNNNGDGDGGGGGGGDRERGRLIMVDGGSLSEYFIGPGFEALLQRYADNDPNRYGTPPALKEAVESLSTVKIQEEDTLQCSVCLDDFVIGMEVKRCLVSTSSTVTVYSRGLSFIVRVRFVGMSYLRMRPRRSLQELKNQMVEVCLLLLLQAAKEVRTVTLLSKKRRAMMVMGLNYQSRGCLAACSRRPKAAATHRLIQTEERNMFLRQRKLL